MVRLRLHYILLIYDSALSYMEARPNEFPMSNLTKIVSKIKDMATDVDADSIRNTLATNDNGNGAVPIAIIMAVLAQFGLNEHEVIPTIFMKI